MAFRIASLYAEFRQKGLGRLSASMGVLRGSLAKVSVVMASAAKAVKIGSLAIAASIGIGIWQAIKFEKQMAMVSTMLDEVGMQRMPEFSKGIRKLSVEFGESTETLAKGMYDILSASVDPAKAMDVLAVSSKAAIGGFTSTAVAADAITTILNSYHMAAEQASTVSDKMFVTVKRGKLTYEELASSIGKAAATSAIAGVSLDELLATIATITRAGIRADNAMTSVVGVLRSFLKPTDEGAKLAKSLGFELNTATLKAEGLSGVFKKLTGLTAEQLAELFPNIRGLKGVAAAMQDATGYAKDLTMMVNGAGMGEEAFGKASDTTAQQLNRLKQGFLDTVRTVGDALLPVIRRLAEGMSGLSSRFNELVDWIRPVGVALEQLWGVMEKAFNLSGLWDTITGALGKAATAVRDFYVYVAATLTTLVAQWSMVWDTMKMAVELVLTTIWEEVKFTFLQRIPEAAKWMVKAVVEALGILGSISAKIFAAYVETWVNALELMVTMAKDFFMELGRLTAKMFTWFAKIQYNAFITMLDMAKDIFPKIWDFYKNSAIETFKALPSLLKKNAEFLQKIWEMTWNPLKTAKKMSALVNEAVSGASAEAKNVEIPLFGKYKLDVTVPDLSAEMARLKELASSFELPGRILTDKESELYKGIKDNIKSLTDSIDYEARLAFAQAKKQLVPTFAYRDDPETKKEEEKEKEKGPNRVIAEFDRGSWSGLADVWKNIQTTIMRKDPLLKEAKEQTGVLTDIRDAVKDLDVSGGATVREGGV